MIEVPLERYQRIFCSIPVTDRGIEDTWNTFINSPLNCHQAATIRSHIAQLESESQPIHQYQQKFKKADSEGTVFDSPASAFICDCFCFEGYSVYDSGYSRIYLGT